MLKPQFIVMTTDFGGRDITPLQEAIPNLAVVTDHNHNAMVNFINSLLYTDEPAVHLEDDVELCDDFVAKITAAVNQYPNHIINFFSLRKIDYEKRKPFFVPGSRYIGNVCFYLPRGSGREIVEFYRSWGRKQEHPTGYDILMADWLKSKGLKYVQWFPHLVNHIEGKSLINPRRSSKRTDKLFDKKL